MKNKDKKFSLAEFLARSQSKKQGIQERAKKRIHEVFSPKDYMSPRIKNGNTVSSKMFPPIESYSPSMLPKIEEK
jgi:hypothetical protein